MKEWSDILENGLKGVSSQPGVYLMKDAKGEVIYVGKAKNLRSRLRSYANGGDGRYNIQFLVKRLDTVETLVTESERQALVLESDLIKKYKPRYNIRLRDDKAHLLVRIDMNHEWPRLQLVRQVAEDGARYVGPFAFSYELKAMLDVIRRTLPLRTCSDRVIYNRVRPCLEYQIKRCSGPCCIEVDPQEYANWLEQAVKILEGKDSLVLEQLALEMERASENLRFEDAALIRDRIEVLKKASAEKPALEFHDGSRDAFGLHREGGNVEVSVLMVRRGRLFEAKSFGFTEVEISDEEMLGSFLSQYYTGDIDLPEEVLLPLELEDADAREELYSTYREDKVKISAPKRGTKARLLTLAESNAKENFIGRFGGGHQEQVLRQLKEKLSLEEVPRTIECVDVSHFQGASTVGSVVMFKDGQPEKSGYRMFHLAQEGKPDDFASMREVMLRHLSRGAEENTLPDLIVVDGGAQQLSQAVGVRNELGLQRPEMIGLAKKRTLRIPYRMYVSARVEHQIKKPERVYLEQAKAPIILEAEDAGLRLLERIRDEAHRFAVSFHRSTRKKKAFSSELENIPGIGPKRRKELLRQFKSVQAIREASPEEIVERCSFPLALAERIVERLSKGSAGQKEEE